MPESHYPECSGTRYQGEYDCICDRLRACEARMAPLGQAFANAQADAYDAALDRARDAVRNTPTDPRWNILQIERAFLAAIDALRGES